MQMPNIFECKFGITEKFNASISLSAFCNTTNIMKYKNRKQAAFSHTSIYLVK